MFFAHDLVFTLQTQIKAKASKVLNDLRNQYPCEDTPEKAALVEDLTSDLGSTLTLSSCSQTSARRRAGSNSGSGGYHSDEDAYLKRRTPIYNSRAGSPEISMATTNSSLNGDEIMGESWFAGSTMTSIFEGSPGGLPPRPHAQGQSADWQSGYDSDKVSSTNLISK